MQFFGAHWTSLCAVRTSALSRGCHFTGYESSRWQGGRLYNPEDGRDYKGSLHLQSPTRLVVDGCVLFICRTQVWRRFAAQQRPPVAAQ
jgi:hypothetical protein